ncbi:Zn-dependent hydrolase [Brevibacillus humidisoli]|uniref:Zn-dependent hydrolase n=1 Tax=Brevibacillus humidisoli TaxID=2895522 RepID=UPI001E315FAE|nr:Zn-dependent hydrolase [Brevibacillus humidisoli]UFJ41793.1 Zn-dependent hydrolase [Brevibacillus humidisoli]
MNLTRFEQTLQEMNRIGALDKGVTRLAYTREEQQAREYFVFLCKRAGLQVRIDPCGNVIARREGRNPQLPAVACGSHLDTVIQGGRFDGTLGVLAALEVVERLNEKGIETEHPIEIISFACEESARFGVSTIGSKAMAGLLKKEQIADLKDKHGISIETAMSECSFDFERVEQAKRKKEELCVFFELHIEQGPILEQEQVHIGIVSGIAAPTRLHVHVQGKASHSGTTPMDLRQDALLGAAEIALQLELAAKAEQDQGTVATIGVCEVKPGAMNVIPDLVELKIDIRGSSVSSKAEVLRKLMHAFETVRYERGLEIEWHLLSDEQPVLLKQEIASSIEHSCKKLGISYRHMSSGAGHDAMNMARVWPTGLIFVPSADGLSHHPDEFTAMADIAAGIAVLEEEVMKWAGASESAASLQEITAKGWI